MAISRIESQNTPRYQSLDLGDAPQTKVQQPKGVGEIHRDCKIKNTPAEMRQDKTICADAKEPLSLQDTPFEILDEASGVGMKPFGDTFNYERMMNALTDSLQAFGQLPPATLAEINGKIAGIQEEAAEEITRSEKPDYERIQAEYYKSMFSMLNEYDSTLSSSLNALREELKNMSSQRDDEFQKIQDRLGRNKWFEWVGMGGTALTGAAAVVSMGTGWGAVAVGVATLAAIALSSDSLLGDPVKHKLATMGAEGDHQTIQDRMENLDAASGFVTVGCSLVNIFVGAGAITQGAGKALTAASSILTGLSQLSVTTNNTYNTLDQQTLEGLNHQIDYDDGRMQEELKLLEDSHSYFQQYARQRRQLLKEKHQAAMQIFR
jgi:hypothetical protein